MSIFIPPIHSVWHFCEKIKQLSSSCFNETNIFLKMGGGGYHWFALRGISLLHFEKAEEKLRR